MKVITLPKWLITCLCNCKERNGCKSSLFRVSLKFERR